jgi:hypothetical protein
MTPQAQDAPQTKKEKLAAIYPARPGDCYVLLKETWPDWPYAKGGDYPVCRSVLANLNKFCDEPPQYSRRKIHPSTRDLEEPVWQALDPLQNRDIVEETYTASAPSPEMRTLNMNSRRAKITSIIESGVLRLWSTDIDVDSDGTLDTVFMLDNLYPKSSPEFNVPTFMIAEQGKRTLSQKAAGIMIDSQGDLFRFSGKWHSIGFSVSPIRELRVYQFIGQKTIATTQLCTIQHVNDYRKK